MKTKLYAIIIALLSQASLSKAQNYFPFPTGDATWQVTRCNYFLPPGWYDDYHIHMTGEDTVINGKTFKKLYFTNHHAPGTDFDTIYPTVFLGGMREENKKIYFVSEYLCIDTMERCVYDFNPVEVGDTIKTQFLTPGSEAIIPHIVTGIDSVLIGSQYHKRLQLTDVNDFSFEEWIEGVGSSYGLIYATFWIVTDNSYDLICFSENNINEWLNPAPGFGFCQSPLPPVECDSLATGIVSIETESDFIYPNPTNGRIIIDLRNKAKIDRYTLADVMGRNVSASPLNKELGEAFEIDLSSFATGVYYLTLFSNKEQLKTFKVIKTD